ncbi:MAG TPA: TetR family transcriptional regulator [Solirubrobacteraceae bacterium]|nr:TetR family transcriptional regulator [Solirubrobacteraceae bacterium]
MSAETPSSERRRAARQGARPRSLPRRPGERARLLAASERLVSERGIGELSVESVCALSGVSRAGFRRSFANRAELLLALHDELAGRAGASMQRAYLAQGSWAEGVRAAIADLLATLERNIPLARFMLVDCAVDESLLPTRRAQLLDEFAAAVEHDRPSAEDAGGNPPFGARAPIAAIAAILHGRLLEEPVPALSELAGGLTGMIVLPYLGPDAARAQLSRPGSASAPRRARASSPATGRDAQRLTLRTLGVLRAIGEHPGLSNTELALASGIADAAQISRLLSRLRSQGLIECEDASSGRAVGKAWRLSPEGYLLLAQATDAA